VPDDQKRAADTASIRAEALNIALGIISEAAKQADTAEPEITLKEALSRHVDNLKRSKRPSARNVTALVKKTFGNLKGAEVYGLPSDLKVHALTPAMLEDLAIARSKEGYAPQTIAHELIAIRAAVNYVAALGFRFPSRMVTRGSHSPWRIPAVRQKTRYLSSDEWQRLYAFLSPERPLTFTSRSGNTVRVPDTPELYRSRQDIQDLFVVLTMTGGRWSEVATLTWDRVDAPNFKTIRIYGRKTHSERMVPVSALVTDVLKRRFDTATAKLVFPGKSGGDARSQHARTKIIVAMDECGFNDPDTVAMHGRATVHSLRHTCASWLIQAGAGIAEVQDMLGHRSLDMTLRYAHLSKGATAIKMARMLDAVVPLKATQGPEQSS